MNKAVEIIFKNMIFAGTCCYPVWLVLTPLLCLAYLAIVTINAVIEAIVAFYKEVVGEFSSIGNPFRYELYEANRVSVRPKLQREYHLRKKREKVKSVFPDIEDD